MISASTGILRPADGVVHPAEQLTCWLKIAPGLGLPESQVDQASEAMLRGAHYSQTGGANAPAANS